MKYLVIVFTLILSSQAWAIKGSCEEKWTPEYELDDLMEVKNWAALGAFSAFANEAGVEFDKKAYLDDCPSWILFNFGRATATSCLEVDVLAGYMSMAWVMEKKYGKSKNQKNFDFKAYYLEEAKKYGADKYLGISNQ